MSSSSRRSPSTRAVFRLSPLVMALALISPLHSYAETMQVSAASNNNIELESHHFHRDHVLGTSLDVVITGILNKMLRVQQLQSKKKFLI